MTEGKYSQNSPSEMYLERNELLVLALLSQYACCQMGILIVRIVGKMNGFITQGPRSNGCRMRGYDTQDKQTNGNLGNIVAASPQVNFVLLDYVSWVNECISYAL